MKKSLFYSLLLALCLTLSSSGFAQDNTANLLENLVSQTNPSEPSASAQPNVVVEMAVLAAIALLPFAVMLLTSYLKMVIVLSLMRNALGVQNSPPNQALTGIALIMAIYVMYPTGVAMYNASEKFIEESAPNELFSSDMAYFLVGVTNEAKEPMRAFLEKNTSPKHIQLFYRLAYQSFGKDVDTSLEPTNFIVLMPAYITTQLKTAFEIGVLIYLPFFVIDLVTSNILLAMGMMMLSPLTISLPLKLLLIVMVDGWTLVIDGIVKTFR